MNKKEILEILKNLNFSNNEYIVLTGASMVVQKVKSKTDNINISVSENLFRKLKKHSTKSDIFLNYDIYKINNYNVYFSNSINLFNKEDLILIDEIYFQSLENIKQMKENLGKTKDKKDIKKIDLFLDLQDNLKYEKDLYNKGYTLIAGVDEVGRGPLVGPVVAAAVILPINYRLEGLTDSKKLSEKKRNYFDQIIKKDAISYGIGVVSNEVIDKINIYEATKLAMKEAISNLNVKPDYILTDAMNFDSDVKLKPLIKGDLRSLTISAASVIAKVYRDNLMYELDKKYPYYNFKHNKGYPTKDHIEAIEKYGIIKEHRVSYQPVSNYIIKNNKK